jgi:hypothetical protein
MESNRRKKSSSELLRSALTHFEMLSTSTSQKIFWKISLRPNEVPVNILGNVKCTMNVLCGLVQQHYVLTNMLLGDLIIEVERERTKHHRVNTHMRRWYSLWYGCHSYHCTCCPLLIKISCGAWLLFNFGKLNITIFNSISKYLYWFALRFLRTLFPPHILSAMMNVEPFLPQWPC